MHLKARLAATCIAAVNSFSLATPTLAPLPVEGQPYGHEKDENMNRKMRLIAAKLTSLALLVVLLTNVFGASAKAQTRESMEMSVASFDALLKTVAPGQKTVMIGDMGWPVETIRAWNQHLKDRLAGRVGTRSTFVLSGVGLWTNGTVPYVFDSEMEKDAALKARIFVSMFEWQKSANLRFVKRSTPASQPNYAEFRRQSAGSGSNAEFGMKSGLHIVNLQSDAPQTLHVTHELGHLLGVAHEQNRPDRGPFVTINSSCFADPSTVNDQHGILPLAGALTVGTYDFDSIMHYPDRNFGTTPPSDATCLQIIANTPANQSKIDATGFQARIEAKGLSALDRAGMASRYGNPLSISGRVKDGSGNGVGNAVITCTGIDPNFPYYGPTVKTAADGTYTLPGTSTGSYSVSASFAGLGFKSRSVTTTNANVTGIDFVPSPVITLAPLALSFAVPFDANTTSAQTFTVKNSGGAGTTLNWAVTENIPWLVINSSADGTSTGEEDTITVSVNATGLSRGEYNGTITVSDPNASNNPQTINVGLYRGGEIIYTGNADNPDCVIPPQVGVPGDPTDWRDNRNWGSFCDILSRVPNRYDKAIIGNEDHVGEFQVNLPADAEVGALELGFDCSLTGRGTLTVNKHIDWTQGTGTNAGGIGCNLFIPSGCVFDIRGGAARSFDGATITNQGTINWQGGDLTMSARLNAAGTDYQPAQIFNNGTFRITANSGTFEVSMSAAGNGTAARVFTNNGTLESDPGAGQTVNFRSLKFNNTNTVDVKSGGLDINSGGLSGSHSGTFQTATGTNFSLNNNGVGQGVQGLQSFSDTVRFSGPGQSRVQNVLLSGTLTAGLSAGGPGRLLLSDYLQASSSVTLKTVGSGVLEVGTPQTGSGGTGLHGGTWTITTGSNVIFDSSSVIDFAAKSLVNQGTLTLKNQGLAFSAANATFTNSGTLNLQMEDNNGVSGANATSLTTFTNTGTINKSNAFTNEISNTIKTVNTGTINSKGGVLQFRPVDVAGATNISSFGGTLKADAGAFIDFAAGPEQQLSNTLITGAGRVRVNGGFVKLIGTVTAGTAALGGTLQLKNGYLSSPSTSKITGPGFLWTGGKVVGMGHLANTNTAGFLNIDVNGTLTIRDEDVPGSVSEKTVFGNSGTGAATLSSAGTVKWEGGNVKGDGTLSVFKNTGTFIASNANLNADSPDLFYGLGTDTVSGFVNTGTLSKIGPGVAKIDCLLSSTGPINATGGILQLSHGTASGTFTAGSGAFIDITSGIANANFKFGDVTFAGAGRTRVMFNAVAQQDGNLNVGTVAGIGTLELQAGTFIGSTSAKVIHGPNLKWTGSIISDRLNASFQPSFAGFINIASDGVLTIEGPDPKTGGAAIKNSGKVDWNEGQLLLSDAIGLDNLAGATFNAKSSGGLGNVFNSGLLRNAGTLNLGTATAPHVLNINVGSFEQTSTGKLNVKIGGSNAATPQFDQILLGNGTIKVAGTLGTKVINSYVPLVNTEFAVLAGGTRTGTFTTIEDQTTTDQRSFKAVYNPSDVTLVTRAPQPALSIVGPPSGITEGDSGTANATFTVTLSEASTQTVTVNYATNSGTATSGSDFVATNGVLLFAAGELSKTIVVPVTGDLLNEIDETFTVTLTSPTKAILGTATAGDTAIATITDDDTAPTLAVGDQRALAEGSAAAPGSTTFAVRLSAPSGKTVTINYATANGVTNGAIAGQDYVAKTGTLTFAPGETLKTVKVDFIGDSVAELNETLFLDIRTPSNATVVDSRGSAYIRNDDGPKIFIDNPLTVNEGNSGTTAQTFTVRLDAASTQTVTVDWSTANNTAGPADYTVASGTLSFAPGQTSKTIVILVKGDTVVEPTETYKVNLKNAKFGIIGVSQAVGYIRNDDVSPLLSTVENDQEQPSD